MHGTAADSQGNGRRGWNGRRKRARAGIGNGNGRRKWARAGIGNGNGRAGKKETLGQTAGSVCGRKED